MLVKQIPDIKRATFNPLCLWGCYFVLRPFLLGATVASWAENNEEWQFNCCLRLNHLCCGNPTPGTITPRSYWNTKSQRIQCSTVNVDKYSVALSVVLVRGIMVRKVLNYRYGGGIQITIEVNERDATEQLHLCVCTYTCSLGLQSVWFTKSRW